MSPVMPWIFYGSMNWQSAETLLSADFTDATGIGYDEGFVHAEIRNSLWNVTDPPNDGNAHSLPLSFYYGQDGTYDVGSTAGMITSLS